MGNTLHHASRAARDVFERADDALGFRLSSLCFEGPEEELTLTANTQPALLTVSTAALAALREAWPELPPPSYAAGHSLGEYSALVAAGALEFEDAVRLVRLRGRAMQEAVPEGLGAMSAIVGADAETVRALCDEARGEDVLSPANFNAPGQVVIAGHASAVTRAGDLAATQKLKAIPLKVSAPFHCALMAPAAERVREALETIAVRAPNFPVVPNVTAEPNDDPAVIKELLVRQIVGSVLWEQSIALMARSGVSAALEIGPGKVLAGLARRIEKSLRVQNVADPEGVAAAAARG
jgi:[acyl-carrier-protein] S-malonyltransferase